MAKTMYDYWNGSGEPTDPIQFSVGKDRLSTGKPKTENRKTERENDKMGVPATSKQNGTTPRLNEEVERGGWGNKLDFLFSCISVSVGLGNVWRFPYLCYKNGGGRCHYISYIIINTGCLFRGVGKTNTLGVEKFWRVPIYMLGAFLVTYTVAMIFCGIPIFFQEVAIGQYLGAGGMTLVGELVPILQGVGYATMTIVFFLDIYYCIIIAWTLFYLISSFVALPGLPWQDCDNWWNTKTCFAPGMDPYVVHNRTNHTTTPVEEFWDKRVLQITGGIHDLGEMQWELFGCLFLGWVLVYLIIRRGIHQSGKIIWFTALFPYVVLFVLLVRAVTLEGAGAGLLYYVTPRWEELLGSRPWLDGATQIFFAYSIGTGALPALGSYNKFYHNCYKDAIITCIVNTLTCLLAGCVTFAILGHIAVEQETEVSEVVKSGPGLVFLTYPEVVLKLPGAPAWAAIFFFMLVILGIDSEFCIVESFITGIVDNWSDNLRRHRNKITLGICLLMFLLGIPMTSQGGVYIFQLMDFYSASGMCLLFVCFFQTIAISWIFGAQRFNDCIHQMMGIRLNKFWLFCWIFLAPGIMATIFIFYIVQYKPVSYGKDYEYPWWAQEIGFAMSFSSMIWIPVYAIYYVFSSPGTIKENIQMGLKPKFKSRVEEATGQPTSQPVISLSESSAGLIKNGSFLSN